MKLKLEPTSYTNGSYFVLVDYLSSQHFVRDSAAYYQSSRRLLEGANVVTTYEDKPELQGSNKER